jgi:hypothetical protein
VSATIEAAARNIVTSVRQMLEHRSEYVPADPGQWPADHRRGYDEVERALVAEGWTVLGDYEDLSHTRLLPDLRSFNRFGRSGDGVVVGTWFTARIPPSAPGAAPSERRCLVLRTWLTDGRVVLSVRGAVDNGCPTAPGQIAHLLDDRVTTHDALVQHRQHLATAGGTPQPVADIDDILARAADDARTTAEFRRSLGAGIFEPMLRKLTGPAFEAQGRPILEAIQQHPEWLGGDDRPQARPVQTFLWSEGDDGRRHLTTLGLVVLGLPELQMKEVAANHMRAARFLMNTVARKLAAQGLADGRADRELSLSRGDVAPDEPYLVRGELAGDRGLARVRLLLERFDEEGDDEGAGLLSLCPPNGATPDDWLPDVCRRLGQDAPRALPQTAMAAEMRAASERARAHLGSAARRLREEKAALFVKTGLPTTSGGVEYVWVRIRHWQPDGTLVGDLASQPHHCPPHRAGDELRLRESDVFDYAIEGEVDHPPATEIVAQEFGVDL